MSYIGTKPANQITDSTLIADGTVTTADLANGAVTAAKIADANVTQAKLATGVAGTGPAFSAWQSSGQSLSAGTWTLLQFQTEEFDTANCFNNTASGNGFSFQPNVAGYYQVSGSFNTQAESSYEQILAIYRNGSSFKFVCAIIPSRVRSCAGSALIYLNGTTDYIQLYGLTSSASGINNNSLNTYFQAALVRAV